MPGRHQRHSQNRTARQSKPVRAVWTRGKVTRSSRYKILHTKPKSGVSQIRLVIGHPKLRLTPTTASQAREPPSGGGPIATTALSDFSLGGDGSCAGTSLSDTSAPLTVSTSLPVSRSTLDLDSSSSTKDCTLVDWIVGDGGGNVDKSAMVHAAKYSGEKGWLGGELIKQSPSLSMRKRKSNYSGVNHDSSMRCQGGEPGEGKAGLNEHKMWRGETSEHRKPSCRCQR